HLCRRSKSIRRRHSLVRIVRSRPSRNAPQYAGRKILVGVQTSLGRPDRSVHRTTRFSRPNEAFPLGPELAAPLPWSLTISFLEKRSRNVAARPQWLLGHAPGPRSTASPNFRAASHRAGDL